MAYKQHNQKPPQSKGGFLKKREWVDAFRTYDWQKAFPDPELVVKEIKHLLSLV